MSRQMEPVDCPIIGARYRLSGYKDDRTASKLMSMGLLPGTVLKVVRRAPFGGGYYFKSGYDYAIALSRKEVESLVLEKQTT